MGDKQFMVVPRGSLSRADIDEAYETVTSDTEIGDDDAQAAPVAGAGATESARVRRLRVRPGEVPESYISTSGVDLRQYRIDFDAPWEDDPACQMLVAMHPQGMTLEEIGIVAWTGNRRRTSTDPRRIRRQKEVEPRPLTRERIRQIEASALRKLRRDEGEGERCA